MNASKRALRRWAGSSWTCRLATGPANLRVSTDVCELLFTTTICQAETLSGLAIMPEGRRRLDLVAAARSMFAEDFEGRVLPFDMDAAAAYADIFAARRRVGRPAATATVDLMIAAVARSQGASVVTRNVADFEECGVAIVNPWAA